MSTETEAYHLLASKFSKRFQVDNTVYLKGLLSALAVGDGYIATQIEATRDNLIAVTASGRFLDRAASRYGIVRGQGAGILDPDFQKMVPILGLSPKQISHILLRIIDIIYGPFASHANITADVAEPYSLTSGQTLLFRVDDHDEQITFETSDAINLAVATAEELATAISAKTNGTLIGSVVLDARTGKRFLNVRTRTIGSQGFVQVLGGEAQLYIQFPQIRPVTGTLATWDVTRFQGTDEMVYTVVAGTAPDLKAAGVQHGDYVTLRADSGFDLKNTGTFLVSFVGVNYFRLVNGDGVQESTIAQVHTNDFGFYRPDLGNVLLSARPAALLETSPRELTILLPVTSPIVKRTLKGGHHFHMGVSSVLGVTSNTVTLASATSFPPVGTFKPVLARNLSHGIVSTIGATTITLINAQNWPNAGAVWAANVRQFFYFSGRSGNVLTGVSPTPVAELAGATVHYVDQYRYTSITSNTLNGVYPDPIQTLNQEVSAGGATTQANFPGSFCYDPSASFIAAQDFTTIQETVTQGSVKTLLRVGDVSSFPAQGHFVLEFGTDTEEGPIRYLAKVGTSGLIIDPSHVFERDHLMGVGLRLVRQIGPYAPRVDGTDLAVYITSTAPARDLLAGYLRLIAASGVRLRFVIRSPVQKWAVLPGLYTTNPTDLDLITV